MDSDTVARAMDPRVVALRSDWTVHKTIGLLRGATGDWLYYLYVTDSENRLVGVVSMRQLLLGRSSDRLESFMSRNIVSVKQNASCEEALGIAGRAKFMALPVVDAEGRLSGVIKPSDLMSIAESEASADLPRLFGAGGDERALSPAGEAVRKRLPWLLVNLATAFLASAVVGLFDDVIAKYVFLAVLLPIVAGQGGNTGAQALAVVIRGLAVKEVQRGSACRILFKEFLAGFVNGTAVALVTSAAVWAWYRNGGLALVIGLAMVVNMVAAGLSGAAIPLMLHAMGRDPAQSSSIFMTTVTDVVGFGAFLGCAVLFSPLMG